MEELIKLETMLEGFLEGVNEECGGEKVQPYICILEGVLKGIKTDLCSE